MKTTLKGIESALINKDFSKLEMAIGTNSMYWNLTVRISDHSNFRNGNQDLLNCTDCNNSDVNYSKYELNDFLERLYKYDELICDDDCFKEFGIEEEERKTFLIKKIF